MRVARRRRWLQIFFLAVFFALLTMTVWPLGRVFLGAFLLADPLLALNSLVNGPPRWEMLLAIPLLVLPLVLGRAFCGYVCPMGTVVELLGPRRAPARERRGWVLRGDAGADAGARPSWLWRAPVYILIAALGLLLFGSGAYLVFDPLVMLTRSSTLLLYPGLDRLLRLAGDLLYLVPPLRGAVDAVTSVLAGRLIFVRPLAFELQFLALAMLVTVLGLSFVERRLWCRHLCPLGALFGQLGRWSLFGRVVDAGACTRCGRCERACPLGAIGADAQATDPTRCQLGFECAGACPAGAIAFGWRRPAVTSTYDPSRRALLTAGGLALLAGFFAYVGRAGAARDPWLVRPPGARPETGFMSLCSRCAQCMKVCPTNVLQPSLHSGIEGFFTPELSFVHGSCDWSCNECGKVCPTGAIQPLALEAKRATVIGRAAIDRNRCIPWADFKDCLVCQELCPTPEKAIVFQPETVRDPGGAAVTLKRPWVVAERCIGCGICQEKCPVPYEAAIRVRGVPPV